MSIKNTVPKVLLALVASAVEIFALALLVTHAFMYSREHTYNEYFGLPVNDATLTICVLMFLVVTTLVAIAIYALLFPEKLYPEDI